MSEKVDVRAIQGATGARYQTALRKYRALREKGTEVLEAYMQRLDAIPDDQVGTPESQLCIDCLAPLTEWHQHNCGP